jgi:hypothetical protein
MRHPCLDAQANLRPRPWWAVKTALESP